ncbi:MAG: hypothetical protein Q7O66_06475, partial [Dehalococcoidia bacterium]|nr:hypothetical protein [Dehalococcoidia bacterium]
WLDDNSVKMINGFNVVPKFKKNPGMIWRGAPKYGQDTDDILAEFNHTPEEIKAFYEQGVVKKIDQNLCSGLGALRCQWPECAASSLPPRMPASRILKSA